MSPFEIFWNSLFQPIHIGNQVFAFSIITIVVEFLLPIGLYLLVAFFGFRWLRGYLTRVSWSEGREAKLLRAVKLCLAIIGTLLVLILGGRFVEVRVIKFFEDIFTMITRPLYHSGSTDISIMTLILAIPVFYLAALTGKASKLAFERSKIAVVGILDSRRSTIANLIRYCVLVLVLVLGLSIIGLDLSSIGLFFGVLGVGIGIGLQQIVANFFSGLLLIINRPIKESDFIQVSSNNQSYRGRIQQVRMLNTVLITNDQETIYVPNSHILNNALHNFSASELPTRISVEVPLAAEQDLDKAESILIEISRRCPQAALDNAAALSVDAIKATSILVHLSFAVKSADEADRARSWVNREIIRKTREKSGLILG